MVRCELSMAPTYRVPVCVVVCMLLAGLQLVNLVFAQTGIVVNKSPSGIHPAVVTLPINTTMALITASARNQTLAAAQQNLQEREAALLDGSVNRNTNHTLLYRLAVLNVAALQSASERHAYIDSLALEALNNSSFATLIAATTASEPLDWRAAFGEVAGKLQDFASEKVTEHFAQTLAKSFAAKAAVGLLQYAPVGALLGAVFDLLFPGPGPCDIDCVWNGIQGRVKDLCQSLIDDQTVNTFTAQLDDFLKPTMAWVALDPYHGLTKDQILALPENPNRFPGTTTTRYTSIKDFDP
ncbi:hypothetical protein WJX72_004201 [[Myrmecia] bisecta]|uniref:Uncharacterized protein n=1 Tax=[Myrmecia] bisecta TaxID=41462 RepID=A0AAW1QRA3_9CHLO